MPTQARSNKESGKDERAKAIDSNPCGICRAFGLPICKGHGKGGSGGDEANDEYSKNDKDPAPQHVPTNIEVKALSSYLENSTVWSFKDDFLYDFNSKFSLFSMVLDLARGLIHFNGKESLSAQDKKDLNEHYDKIEEEFKQFTKEVNAENISISREGNNLKISIPDPKLYDQFVSRLLNKNLIPDNNYNADLVYKTNQSAEQNVAKKEVTPSYTSPNPFDISKGPRFATDFNV